MGHSNLSTLSVPQSAVPQMQDRPDDDGREQRLSANHGVREGLIARLKKRFPQVRMGDF